MRSAIRIAAVRGTPVVADVSALVLVLLFAGAVLIDLRLADLPDAMEILVTAAILGGVVALASVAVHELSHALVAERRGLTVREIRLFMFGGYSVIQGKPSPRDELAVAGAGPVASITLGVACAVVWFVAGDASVVGRVSWALMLLNLVIGVTNVVPGFPLDGGRMLRGVLTARGSSPVQATARVMAVGRVVGWIIVGVGLFTLVRGEFLGLFLGAFGWFITGAASSAGRREELSAAFDGMTVGDVMRETPDAVPGEWTVSTMLDLHALGPSLRSLPVEIGGRVVGVIGQPEIEDLAPSRWPSVRVRARMSEIGPADVVDVGEPLESLMLRPAGRTRRAVIVADNTVVGIVDGEALGRFLQPGQ